MKFGTKVKVERGGSRPSGTPGCQRTVLGVLVGRRGNECSVKLLEDDPLDTVGWLKAGQIGIWCKSAVTRADS